MENLAWGLQMTVLGMGLVFALLALLWGLLMLVLVLDKEPKPPMSAHATHEPHHRYVTELAGETVERAAGDLRKLTHDPRVTRVGAIIRKSSIDEWPQLLNVLAGQMSIVGPRPAVKYELDLYRPEHFERFNVRPGITGLWQVSGRNRLGFNEMLELDVEYARRHGLALDIWIMLRTPLAVLRADTA